MSSDIVTDAQGQLERQATALKIAGHYSGFDTLAEADRGRVLDYILGQLPQADAAVGAGTQLSLHGYITVLVNRYENTLLAQEDHYQAVGQSVSAMAASSASSSTRLAGPCNGRATWVTAWPTWA